MKLVFTPTAEAQASEMDRWWREHREKAPDLFARELAETCALITATPTLGTTYATVSGKTVRRVRLPKTRNHVYFDFDDATETLVVVAVWGAPRAAGPEI